MSVRTRITALPQAVLNQVLDTYRSRPDTMTDGERLFADRIRSCCLCFHKWVLRSRKDPTRCPKCQKRGWNRPLVNAFIMAEEGREIKRGKTTDDEPTTL